MGKGRSSVFTVHCNLSNSLSLSHTEGKLNLKNVDKKINLFLLLKIYRVY